MEPWSAVIIHPADDVAVALRSLEPGEVSARKGADTVRIKVAEPVPLGHKLALRDIAGGRPVRKYGEPIGVASAPIQRGGHVHVHNLRSRRAVSRVGEKPIRAPGADAPE
jgi:hypothetical protein